MIFAALVPGLIALGLFAATLLLGRSARDSLTTTTTDTARTTAPGADTTLPGADADATRADGRRR